MAQDPRQCVSWTEPAACCGSLWSDKSGGGLCHQRSIPGIIVPPGGHRFVTGSLPSKKTKHTHTHKTN